MKNEQIELNFVATNQVKCVKRRERRRARAEWWFQQMRLAVERSIDWRPAPVSAARPEQIYMPLCRTSPETRGAA